MADCFEDAALRHYKGADTVFQKGDVDLAGYLIGLAAECALKHNDPILAKNSRPRDGHFPYLHSFWKNHTKCSRFLAAFPQNPLNGWEISHRYCQNATIKDHDYNRWRKETARILHYSGLQLPLP
jgi:hypothetical protein